MNLKTELCLFYRVKNCDRVGIYEKLLVIIKCIECIYIIDIYNFIINFVT